MKHFFTEIKTIHVMTISDFYFGSEWKEKILSAFSVTFYSFYAHREVFNLRG